MQAHPVIRAVFVSTPFWRSSQTNLIFSSFPMINIQVLFHKYKSSIRKNAIDYLILVSRNLGANHI